MQIQIQAMRLIFTSSGRIPVTRRKLPGIVAPLYDETAPGFDWLPRSSGPKFSREKWIPAALVGSVRKPPRGRRARLERDTR
jgi:hypothetical protein